MKKLFFILLAIVLAIGIILGVLLFTPSGNAVVKPILEARLNAKLPQKLKLEVFELRPFAFKIKLVLEDSSCFFIKGDYNLFLKTINALYGMKIIKMESLQRLINTYTDIKLRGSLSISGKIEGSQKVLSIDGSSDIASSKTSYHVVLRDFRPDSVIAAVRGAHLDKLLYMFNQPLYSSGLLDIDAKLNDLDPQHLSGVASVVLKRGDVNRGVMRRVFDVKLPKTRFSVTSKFDLSGRLVDMDAKFRSNLGDISVNGKFNSADFGIDGSYLLDIAELGLFRPVTKVALRGPLFTKGIVKGNRNKLVVDGSSNIASSKTSYHVVLRDFRPLSANIAVKKAKLDKIFYIANKPAYAKGNLNIGAKLTNLVAKKVEGTIKAALSNGLVNTAVVKKEFKLSMPKTTFDATINTNVKKSVAVSKLQVNSSIAKLIANKAIFNIGKAMLNSDYQLVIPDLDKLYFISEHHLRGGVTVNGFIEKAKNLVVTAHSDMLGGKVDVKLVDDKVTKTVRGVEVTALTDMLMYPKVFDSTMDADITYNLKTKKGLMKAKLFDGHILPNTMTFLLNQVVNFDITKEVYKKADIISKIADNIILSDMDIQSEHTRITSKNALIDTKKDKVDARLRIDIGRRTIYAKIKGNIRKPEVSLDVKEILENELRKQLEKRLPKKLKEFMNIFN